MIKLFSRTQPATAESLASKTADILSVFTKTQEELKEILSQQDQLAAEKSVKIDEARIIIEKLDNERSEILSQVVYTNRMIDKIANFLK